MNGPPSAPPRVEPPPPGRLWTVIHMVKWSAQYLADREVPNPRLDAEYLLGHVLECDRMALYLQFDRPLDPEELARFKPLLLRRAAREPLQYILGSVSFRRLELRVDPRALIPRPETEELVDVVLEWSAGRGGPVGTALDLGTGTGAILLSLALEGGFSALVGVDASSDALALARENESTVRNSEASVDVPNGNSDVGRSGPLAWPAVEFLQGDLYAPVAGRRFDVVVSNPPYVGEDEREGMAPEVLDHEPSSALFSGPDGLGHLRRIVAEAPNHLTPGGLLALEIGAGQGDAVLRLAHSTTGLCRARIRQDLAGRDRFLIAERE